MSDFSSSLSCNITTLKVAGAALGRSRDNANDTANGIAEEAKLHIFDIQQGSGEFEFDENAWMYHIRSHALILLEFYLILIES